MMDAPKFPQIMVHPQHKPAVVQDFNAANALPGAPERFPPVEVNNADQEEEQRARGYLRYGENMPKAAEYSEFPKMMHHPDHVEPVPPTMGMRIENGNTVQCQIPGVPGKLLPVTVSDPAEQTKWEEKGYEAPAPSDAALAFERATLAPGKPGDEWPKWVDGVLTQDPDAPPDMTGQYPKWLHFEGGDSALVDDAAHEARVLSARGKEPEPAKQPDKPYVAPAVAVDPEYEEFRAWKAQRDAAQEAADAETKVEEERAALLAQAEEAGVSIDRRWGLARLREAVAATQNTAEAAD